MLAEPSIPLAIAPDCFDKETKMLSFSGLGSLLVLPSLLVAAFVDTDTNSSSLSASWSGWGSSFLNSRWAPGNAQISLSTIQSLASHCQVFYDGGGVSATPVVNCNIVYYPTWSGLFVALDYVRCEMQWQMNITAVIELFAPITTDQAAVISPVSRTSPQLDFANNVLFLGTLTHALIVAADLLTGDLLATVQVHAHPLAMVTMSPTLYDGLLLVGTASAEESAAYLVPEYQCCSFIGNVAALSFTRSSSKAGTFHTVWNVSTLPTSAPNTLPADSWSGGGVWGSQPSIDAARDHVLFGTGNVYTAPQTYLACRNRTSSTSSPSSSSNTTDLCLPPNAWQESILALDVRTGTPAWVRQISPLDAWTLACGVQGYLAQNTTLCPETPGPDADFGMAPTYVPDKDLVVVGQKSGILHALGGADGAVKWSVATGPGAGGGLSWGIAVDETAAYFTAINYLSTVWTPGPASGNGTAVAVNCSAWGAASLGDGTLQWESVTPADGMAFNPPTVVGDVMLVGRSGPSGLLSSGPGSLLALDKTTGKILLELPLDTTFRGGIAVQGQYVLFGTGYSRVDNGTFYVLRVAG